MSIFKSFKIELNPINSNNITDVSIKKDRDLKITYKKDGVEKEKRIEIDTEKLYISPKVLDYLQNERTLESLIYLLINGYKALKYSIIEIKIEIKAEVIIISFNTLFPYDFEIEEFKRLQFLYLDLNFKIKGI